MWKQTKTLLRFSSVDASTSRWQFFNDIPPSKDHNWHTASFLGNSKHHFLFSYLFTVISPLERYEWISSVGFFSIYTTANNNLANNIPIRIAQFIRSDKSPPYRGFESRWRVNGRLMVVLICRWVAGDESLSKTFHCRVHFHLHVGPNRTQTAVYVTVA